MEVGERIWNMEREYNAKAGLTAADDNLPDRLKSLPANAGPATGKVSEVDKMLPEYYAVRGWGTDGNVTSETHQRLGLPGPRNYWRGPGGSFCRRAHQEARLAK